MLALAKLQNTGRVVKLVPGVDPVTDDNWMLLAMRSYDNPSCASVAEFHEDMQRFKYVRKLLTQYARGGELKERLVLNHIILLGNVLGPAVTVRILFLKMHDQLGALLPFLVLLNVLPDVVKSVGRDCRDVTTDDIPLDQVVVDALRRI